LMTSQHLHFTVHFTGHITGHFTVDVSGSARMPSSTSLEGVVMAEKRNPRLPMQRVRSQNALKFTWHG
jgi:hypothetical protein